jgi:hypothetical protein
MFERGIVGKPGRNRLSVLRGRYPFPAEMGFERLRASQAA